MASVTYTALRDFGTGHTVGNTYYLDFGASVLNRKNNRVAITTKSISGVRETIHQRNELRWEVTATFIPTSAIEFWREFFGSVSHGESFVFDPYGTYASPSDAVNVVLDIDSWDEVRLGNTVDYYDISFVVEVI